MPGRHHPRPRSPLALLLAVLALGPTCLAAQAAPAPTPRSAIADLRAMVRDSMARTLVPGLAIAVAVHGDVVWSEGFGLVDVEAMTPVTRETRFRAGSVSKPLTAAALARLMERGRLDLDRPVQAYVPDFPVKESPVTLRQLAGHLAGIRHYQGDEFLSAVRYPNVTSGLWIFAGDPLVAPPGERFHYSSYGWNLLSAALEGAAGDDFLRVMAREVFDPLGLRHTGADHTDSTIPGRTGFYARESGRIARAPYVDNSHKWAGGGFLSSAEDLVRFGSAMLAPGYLRQETLERLFTSQRTRSGRETGYGIGWYVGRDGAGRRIVYHSGGSVGGSAYLILYPDHGVVAAALANIAPSFVGSAAREAARRFLP